jgi:hypothetical protein
MITVAIGRPMPKATAMTERIAESKSSSGCTLLSSDMAYTKFCLEAPGNGCSIMVNKTLIALSRAEPND